MLRYLIRYNISPTKIKSLKSQNRASEKGYTMDNGTKLRTILAIATSLNTALIATDVTGFQNEKVDFVYKVLSLILNFIIVALATYFNNDYTEEASVGTDITRKMKNDPTLVPCLFDPDVDEEPEEDDLDDGDEVIE